MRTLVIDASSPTLFVGVMENNAWLTLLKKDTGALEGLFDVAKSIFADFPLESFQRIALCEGPGRLMSLRVAAVAGNQWVTNTSIERWTYNSLELASLSLGRPAAYELRANTFAQWQNSKAEVAEALPAGAVLINAKDASYTIESFPSFADKILRRVEFFDPPIFAPTDYVKATSKVVSRDK